MRHQEYHWLTKPLVSTVHSGVNSVWIKVQGGNSPTYMGFRRLDEAVMELRQG